MQIKLIAMQYKIAGQLLELCWRMPIRVIDSQLICGSRNSQN